MIYRPTYPVVTTDDYQSLLRIVYVQDLVNRHLAMDARYVLRAFDNTFYLEDIAIVFAGFLASRSKQNQLKPIK